MGPEYLPLLSASILAINFRSLRYGLIQAPPHKWLLLAIAWELLLIAGLIQLPAVRDAFGIGMPSAPDLGIIVAFSVIVAIAIEIAKFVFRRNDRLNTAAHVDFSEGR